MALEDAPAGITAARAAGVKVIARTTHDDQELREADAIIDNLSVIAGPSQSGVVS